MAFVELEECISIEWLLWNWKNVLVFSLSKYLFFFFFFFFISFLDFMSRIAVIWISSPELSYVCHTYAMPICAPMWAENS